MSKRILIYGSYGGGNYGDAIILEALLQNLTTDYEVGVLVGGDVNKISKRPDVELIPLWKTLPHTKKTNLRRLIIVFKSIPMISSNIKKYDIILIGGGNMIMDLFPRNVYIIFMLYCLSKIHRKKICFIGCGAGPIYRSISKVLFKIPLSMADLITLRDSTSCKLVKQLCPSNKNIFDCSDLIFSHEFFYENVNRNNQKIECIAINIIAYKRPNYYPRADEQKYKDYCLFIIDIINYLITCDNIKKILLFTTSHFGDDYALKDIKDYLGPHHDKRIFFFDKSISFIDLSRILENYDLIISYRLHSLLLSICLNKIVIPLIYQEKVENFVGENNLDSVSVDIRKISQKSLYRFKSIFKKIINDPPLYLSQISRIKVNCSIKSKKNFELIRKYY